MCLVVTILVTNTEFHYSFFFFWKKGFSQSQVAK